VDLAKALDFTSFAVIEMVYDGIKGDFMYHLRGLDRIRGVDYPTIVKLIVDAIKNLDSLNKWPNEFSDGPHLCMDASGLGAPIKDYLKQAHALTGPKKLYPVVFTGGERARFDPDTKNYNISKMLMISNFLSLMQHKRFDYAPDLQALPLLEQEIASFKYHLTPGGRTTADAATGQHDDLISAICIPLMIGEWKFRRGKVVPII
jgi:hypothetical protein